MRDLGNHKRENHPPIVKQKVHSGTANQATPSPVSHGNQKPAPSPVLLPGQIPCPVCKIACNDRQTLLGHVSAEHPSYQFMCDEANCFKAYISKSGLFKHKKPIFHRIVMTGSYVWIVMKLSNVKMIVTIMNAQHRLQNQNRKSSLKLNTRKTLKVKVKAPLVEKGTLEALELRKKNKNEMFPCFYFRTLVVASGFQN